MYFHLIGAENCDPKNCAAKTLKKNIASGRLTNHDFLPQSEAATRRLIKASGGVKVSSTCKMSPFLEKTEHGLQWITVGHIQYIFKHLL